MTLSEPHQSFYSLQLEKEATEDDRQMTSAYKFNENGSPAIAEGFKRRAPHHNGDSDYVESSSTVSVNASKENLHDNDADFEPAAKIPRGGGRRKQSKPLRMCADTVDTAKDSPERFSMPSNEPETFSVNEEQLHDRFERSVIASPSPSFTAVRSIDNTELEFNEKSSHNESNLLSTHSDIHFGKNASQLARGQNCRDEGHSENRDRRKGEQEEDFPTKYHQRGQELKQVLTVLPLNSFSCRDDSSSKKEKNDISDVTLNQSQGYNNESVNLHRDVFDPVMNGSSEDKRLTKNEVSITNDSYSQRFKHRGLNSRAGSTECPDSLGMQEESFKIRPLNESSPTGALEANKDGLDGSSGKSRILHADAYCELCEREFCNKYFLKTHKANKHGIYDATSSANEPTASDSAVSAAETAVDVSTNKDMFSMFNLLQQQQMFNSALSGFNGGMLLPQPSKLEMPLKSNPARNASPVGMTMPLRHERQTPSPSGRNLMPSDMEDYCDFCQKHFCNKYYLRKHKLDVHCLGMTQSSFPDGSSSSANKRSAQQGTWSSPRTTFDSESPMSSASRVSACSTSVTTMPASVPHASSAVSAAASSLPYLNNMAAAANLMLLNPFASPFGLMPQLFPPVMGGSNAPRQLSITDSKSYQGGGGGLGSSMSSDMGMQSSILQSLSMLNAEAYMDLYRQELSNRFMMGMGAAGSGAQEGNKSNVLTNEFDGLFGRSSLNEHTVKNESKADQLEMIDMFRNRYSSPGTGLARKEEMVNGTGSNLQDKFNRMLASGGAGGSVGGDRGVFGSMAAAKLVDRVTCDICNKEVCNKYFLRTHKIKVHGWDPDHNGTITPEASLPVHDRIVTVKQEASPAYPFSNISSQPKEQGETFGKDGGRALGGGGGGGGGGCGALGGDGRELMPIGRPMEQELLNMGIDPEAYCEICKKEFCSKYFLRTHRQNIHGIKPLDGGTESGGGGGVRGGGGVTAAESAYQASENGRRFSNSPDGGRRVGNDSGGSRLFVPPKASNSMSSIDPGILTVAHLNLLATAGINLQAFSAASGSGGANGSGSGGIYRSSPQINTAAADSSSQDGWKSDGGQRDRKWNSFRWKEPMNATRATCDICSKALCNKYFLRTHMAKCHGISYDTFSGKMNSEASNESASDKIPNGRGNDSSGDDASCRSMSNTGDRRVDTDVNDMRGDPRAQEDECFPRVVTTESCDSRRFGHNDRSRDQSPMNLVLSESTSMSSGLTKEGGQDQSGFGARGAGREVGEGKGENGGGVVAGGAGIGCSTVVAKTWTVPAVASGNSTSNSNMLKITRTGEDIQISHGNTQFEGIIAARHKLLSDVDSHFNYNPLSVHGAYSSSQGVTMSSEAATKIAIANHIRSQQQSRRKIFLCSCCPERFSSRVDCDDHMKSAHEYISVKQSSSCHDGSSDKVEDDGNTSSDVSPAVTSVRKSPMASFCKPPMPSLCQSPMTSMNKSSISSIVDSGPLNHVSGTGGEKDETDEVVGRSVKLLDVLPSSQNSPLLSDSDSRPGNNVFEVGEKKCEWKDPPVMQSFQLVEETSGAAFVRHFADSVVSLLTLHSITEPMTVTFTLTPINRPLPAAS